MSMKTIVIVDDEIWALVSLKALFDREDLGFSVAATFRNELEAVQFIREHRPDYAFVDIRMPNMDGIELTERLRQICPSTKVVIISAFADFEYAQKAIRQGVLDYIVKPVTVTKAEELLGKLGALDAPADEADLNAFDAEETAEPDTFELILEYVQLHYSEPLQLSRIAQQFFINESYCSTLFHARLGTTFTAYVRQLRLEKATSMLSHTTTPIKSISSTVGYPDYLYFSRIFRRQYGMSPSDYRKIYLKKEGDLS